MADKRIAAVQHGDYVSALRIIGRGEQEPYFGMAYTLDVLRELFGDSPHLVISLNAPPYCEIKGESRLVGLPCPSLPRFLPKSVALALWGRQVVKEVHDFGPTHVLLRSGGVVALKVLDYCIARDVNTLAVFANRFDRSNIRGRVFTRRLVRRLNHPCVRFVGNHKHPATTSMVECGVDPRKAVAWDWPNAKHPRDWPAKELSVEHQPRLLYVGSISAAKGVGDLLSAVDLLWRMGREVQLTVIGDGPDLANMKARADQLPAGAAKFCGRMANEEAFQAMLDATVVCVPSRHEFSEGMPLTLTEALASRTPSVISDHPVLVKAFSEGEGVRFFSAKDPAGLAEVLWSTVSNPDAYHRLSLSTIDAFNRVECRTSFGDLVDRWKATFA